MLVQSPGLARVLLRATMGSMNSRAKLEGGENRSNAQHQFCPKLTNSRCTSISLEQDAGMMSQSEAVRLPLKDQWI